jgi:RNA polymerase primary sigma factor
LLVQRSLLWPSTRRRSRSEIGIDPGGSSGETEEKQEVTMPPEAVSLALDNLLDTLTPRQRHILQLRLGVVDGQQRTPEEVGKRMGVTCERIQQIEAEGLQRLSDPSRSQWLAPFLHGPRS